MAICERSPSSVVSSARPENSPAANKWNLHGGKTKDGKMVLTNLQ